MEEFLINFDDERTKCSISYGASKKEGIQFLL